jgi:Calpain family cysteine protease
MFTSQSSKSLTDLTTNTLNDSTSPLSTIATGLTEPFLQRSIPAASNASTNLVAETGIIIVGGSPTIATELTSLVSTNSNLLSRSNDIVSLVHDPLPSQKSKLTDRWVTQERPLNDDILYLIDPTADDTFAGAYDLGNLNGKTAGRFSDISASDRIDYTRFHLDQTSSFNLLLKGAVGNVAVDLLNASGTTIASSSNGLLYLSQGIATTQNFDTHDVALNLSSLAAGDYYLKVSPFWDQQRSGRGPLGRYYPATTVATDYDLTVSTEIVSNLLPTEVDLGTLSGVRLLKGSLDANNTSEVYRVTVGAGNLHITLSGMNGNADVRLIRDVNNDGVINENEAFASSKQWYAFTDGIYNAVRGGTYFIQVSQGQDFFGASINYDLGISTGDWYTNNLSDYGIIAKARLAGADSWIDRNEMISILREAKDFNAIDVTELADLRTVLSDLGHAMPESVRNLANKVLNGDPANTRAGGSNIGNMYGGDSSDKLESLIGKWFLGTDRPVAMSSDGKTTYNYKPVQGQLFQNGITYTDINQNDLGDCYFLAGLAATALRTPDVLQNMFIANGDNTWTVRFYHDGIADYVTVDNWLPTSANSNPAVVGKAVFADWGGNWSNNPNNELWVALAEKAYVQLNESGVIGQDGTNSYQGISGGLGKMALSHITGRNTQNGHVNWGILNQNDDIGKIVSAWNTNQLVILSTKNDSNAVYSNIASNHAYTMVGYDGNTFLLYNPWGIDGGTPEGQSKKDGFILLNKKQLMANFSTWESTVA